jgi:predicted RNase H-like HicB family nuclease
MRYLAIIEKGATSFGAFVPDLPGCVAIGESEEEVIELITEAIEFHLEDLTADGHPIPPALAKSQFIEVSLAA